MLQIVLHDYVIIRRPHNGSTDYFSFKEVVA